MIINHTIDAIVFFLESYPVLNGSEIPAKMDIARRLDAGEYLFFAFHVC